jgi:hypothetical protein
MNVITLDDGRSLGIQSLTALEAMALAEGCGDLSGIGQWWILANIAASIRTIDGIALPPPTHRRHIEGVLSRFSQSDLDAIMAIAEASNEEVDLDLSVAPMTPLETLRIWAIIGEFEEIPAWVGSAFIASQVRSINGEKICFPESRSQLKETVAKLGMSGMLKASTLLAAQSDAKQAGEADAKDAIKN